MAYGIYNTPRGGISLEPHDIYVISGEGEQGKRERYLGKQTCCALRARLTRECCGGDRWAVAEIDGYRVPYSDIYQWL